MKNKSKSKKKDTTQLLLTPPAPLAPDVTRTETVKNKELVSQLLSSLFGVLLPSDGH